MQRRAGLALASALALGLGLASPAAAQQTTEDATIGGNDGAAYSTLGFGPGWERVVRDDLAAAGAGRATTRSSLLSFAQLSDFQLADEESPARLELGEALPTFSAAWRPQEALAPFMVDQAIRAVNQFDESPIAQGDGSHAPLELTLTTGDSADSNQRNEVQWVVRLLEGGRLNPNSGVAGGLCGLLTPPGEAARYTGVQDYDDYLEGNNFYDPDQPLGPFAAWPRYPGLMDRAQRPFTAAGLDTPSYVAFGNHDALTQGTLAANLAFEAISTGCLKPMGPVPLAGLSASFLTTRPSQLVAVPPDERRQYLSKPQYRRLHATGAQPDAHGFGYVEPAELRASNGAASYYTWTPKPGVRFVGLETVAEGAQLLDDGDGNIDDPQFRWLRRKLDAAEAAGELVVVFGHHPIPTLVIDKPDELALPCLLNDRHGHDLNPGCDRDPRASSPVHLGGDLRALLLSHPNVIAFVAGHTHFHSIRPHRRAGGGGFWAIETASEIDWPVQSRLLDVMDNGDDTLSIFGTLVDHLGPVAAPPSGTRASTLQPVDLATIGRTFAFNDPQKPAGRVGVPGDRNVELLVPDPR